MRRAWRVLCPSNIRIQSVSSTCLTQLPVGKTKAKILAFVVGNGVGITIGYLGPCALNAPHTHPRASEVNFSINTTLTAGFIAENGARFVSLEIRPNTAVVFPQGVIHFEFNDNCEPGMFVATFNNEDPGVQQTAQRCKEIYPLIYECMVLIFL